jgi:hypothetical protein
VNPNARFCPRCGAALQPEPGQEQPAAYQPAIDPGGAASMVIPQSDAPITTAGGFFSALFDFSFSTFVTTRIIKVLYILSIVLAGLAALGLFFSLAFQGVGGVIGGIIVAPLLFLFYVILARVWMEIIIVLFRIAENTFEIARNSRR